PELEEGRPVLGENSDAPLPPDALGDQAVGHLAGPPIELTIGDTLSLEMDGYPIGTGSGVTAGDIADPGNFGTAGDIVHAFLPIALRICLSRTTAAPRGCGCTMLGIFGTDGERVALARIRVP